MLKLLTLFGLVL